jgi:hypothetical protein
VNGEFILQGGKIFEGRTNAGVMQDKYPPGRFSVASPQPLTAITPAVNRPKHHGSEKRQTQQIAGKVPPHVKAEVVRIAKLKGWTESYTVNTLVQQGLAHNIAESFGVMLRATIQEVVTTVMKKEMNRVVTFSREGFTSSEQGRVIGIYVLRYLLGKDIDLLPDIIKESIELAGEQLKQVAGEEVVAPAQWQS